MKTTREHSKRVHDMSQAGEDRGGQTEEAHWHFSSARLRS